MLKVTAICVAHFWAINILVSLLPISRQILNCFCFCHKETLVKCVVCLLRTSPLGDLHNRDEREENPVGGGRQYGSS